MKAPSTESRAAERSLLIFLSFCFAIDEATSMWELSALTETEKDTNEVVRAAMVARTEREKIIVDWDMRRVGKFVER